MTDLDLLVIGALVSFLAAAGAYVAVRRRANDSPVHSFAPVEEASPAPVVRPQAADLR